MRTLANSEDSNEIPPTGPILTTYASELILQRQCKKMLSTTTHHVAFHQGIRCLLT